MNTDPEVRLHATFAPLELRCRVGRRCRPSRARSAPASSSGRGGSGSASRRSWPWATRPTCRGNDLLRVVGGRRPDRGRPACPWSPSATRAGSARVAPQVSRAKPVVAVKVGRGAATPSEPELPLDAMAGPCSPDRRHPRRHARPDARRRPRPRLAAAARPGGGWPSSPTRGARRARRRCLGAASGRPRSRGADGWSGPSDPVEADGRPTGEFGEALGCWPPIPTSTPCWSSTRPPSAPATPRCAAPCAAAAPPTARRRWWRRSRPALAGGSTRRRRRCPSSASPTRPRARSGPGGQLRGVAAPPVGERRSSLDDLDVERAVRDRRRRARRPRPTACASARSPRGRCSCGRRRARRRAARRRRRRRRRWPRRGEIGGTVALKAAGRSSDGEDRGGRRRPRPARRRRRWRGPTSAWSSCSATPCRPRSCRRWSAGRDVAGAASSRQPIVGAAVRIGARRSGAERCSAAGRGPCCRSPTSPPRSWSPHGRPRPRARSRRRRRRRRVLLRLVGRRAEAVPELVAITLDPIIVAGDVAGATDVRVDARRPATPDTRPPRSALRSAAGGRYRGRPRTRSPRMLRRIWVVPPMIV